RTLFVSQMPVSLFKPQMHLVHMQALQNTETSGIKQYIYNALLCTRLWMAKSILINKCNSYHIHKCIFSFPGSFFSTPHYTTNRMHSLHPNEEEKDIL